jgi:hypothetical protein
MGASHYDRENGTSVSDGPIMVRSSVDANRYHNIFRLIPHRGSLESRVFSGRSTDQSGSGLDYA